MRSPRRVPRTKFRANWRLLTEREGEMDRQAIDVHDRIAFSNPNCAAQDGATAPMAEVRFWPRTGPGPMSDLSPLSGEERKSNFGAVRSVDDPNRSFKAPHNRTTKC